MTRKLRPAKSTNRIKEEQNNILLEDFDRNLEESKKAIELKYKQLNEAKKFFREQKDTTVHWYKKTHRYWRT